MVESKLYLLSFWFNSVTTFGPLLAPMLTRMPLMFTGWEVGIGFVHIMRIHWSISSLGSIIISRKTYKLSFVNRRKFSSFILHILRFFSDYRKYRM